MCAANLAECKFVQGVEAFNEDERLIGEVAKNQTIVHPTLALFDVSG